MADHFEVMADQNSADHSRFPYKGPNYFHTCSIINISDVHSQETTVSTHRSLVKNIFAQTSKPQLDAKSLSNYTGEGFIVDQPVQHSSLLFMESICGDTSCELALFPSVPSLPCEHKETPILVVPKFSRVWSFCFDFNPE